MDFDNRKVYGDTSITDGLVVFLNGNCDGVCNGPFDMWLVSNNVILYFAGFRSDAV